MLKKIVVLVKSLFMVTFLGSCVVLASAASFNFSSPVLLSVDSAQSIPVLSKGDSYYYTFTLPKNALNLSLTLTGTNGDADIYLNKDKIRTSKTSTWRSAKSSSNEKITIARPVSGTYYLTLIGYEASSNLSLTLRYTDATTGAQTLVKQVPVTVASMSQEEEKLFTFTLPSSTTNLTVTTKGADGDVDIYLNRDTLRSTKLSTWKSTGDTSDERIVVTSAAAGTYYLSLRAYTPSSNTVVTMDYGTTVTPVPTPTPTPISGSCGTSANQTLSAAPATGLCAAGAANSVTTTDSSYIWACSGSSGGTVASCSASKPAVVTPTSGSCGTSSNQTLSSTPTTGLCAAGAASSVTSGTSYTWTCSSSNGGTTASCSASKTVVVTPTITNYTLTTSATNGTITTGGTYASGTSVTLTATPATGYTFSSFTGCTSTSANTCTVLMTGNKSVSASFTLTPVVTTSGQGLSGAYFNNQALSGAPVATRTEIVNFDWVQTSPIPGVVSADGFSIRWTGSLVIPATGSYEFQTVADDGVRLRVNTTFMIDDWTGHAATTKTSGGIPLVAGQRVPLSLEYYDGGGPASVVLRWKVPGTSTFTVIPLTNLIPEVAQPVATPINATCGQASGVASVATPSSGLCNVGTASSVVKNSSTYTWSCAGSTGGSSVSCSAPVLATGGISNTVGGVDRPTPNAYTPEWSFCTRKYFDGCTFTGLRDIRYGDGNKWVVKRYYGSFGGSSCHPDNFGVAVKDQQPGDHCEVSTAPLMGTLATPATTQHGGSYPTIDLTSIPLGINGTNTLIINPTSDFGAPSDIGAFRVPCMYSHMAFNDPIVYPGQTGKSHLHTFFGNTGVNAYSTAQTIANSPNSTCAGGSANHSSYWVPSLIDTATGKPVIPTSGLWYYKTGYLGVKPQDVKPVPAGLRMITGDMHATAPQDAIVRWSCSVSGLNSGGTIPNCPPGETLDFSISFPQCWDGVNLDSSDHKSHMAFASGRTNGCPPSHPVALPVLSLNIHYDVKTANETTKWRLSSDHDGLPSGYSSHADFFEGWNRTVINTFTTHCLNKSKDCHGFLLGDGTTLDFKF